MLNPVNAKTNIDFVTPERPPKRVRVDHTSDPSPDTITTARHAPLRRTKKFRNFTEFLISFGFYRRQTI
jgi:hypothetical protein